MSNSGIKITLNANFEGLLEEIEKAGGSIDGAARECISKSAEIMDRELKKQMQADGVPANIINDMQAPEVAQEGNTFRAEVGFKLGNYDSKKLSSGFKALFLNYGTPHGRETKNDKQRVKINGRWVTLGKDRGVITARGFITRAKENANKPIKNQQSVMLKEILEGLKND